MPNHSYRLAYIAWFLLLSYLIWKRMHIYSIVVFQFSTLIHLEHISQDYNLRWQLYPFCITFSSSIQSGQNYFLQITVTRRQLPGHLTSTLSQRLKTFQCRSTDNSLASKVFHLLQRLGPSCITHTIMVKTTDLPMLALPYLGNIGQQHYAAFRLQSRKFFPR